MDWTCLAARKPAVYADGAKLAGDTLTITAELTIDYENGKSSLDDRWSCQAHKPRSILGNQFRQAAKYREVKRLQKVTYCVSRVKPAAEGTEELTKVS